jgi:LacI family transcriptional regulator
VAGYLRAAAHSGLKVDNKLIQFGSFSQESGKEMACQVLAESPPPTAIFAANNFLAIGALRALAEAGLSVPEDISLVAFDDLPPHLVITPFLTVAAQPAYEMGRQGMELLLARLAGKAPADYQEIILPTPLIIRSSSGPPPRP